MHKIYAVILIYNKKVENSITYNCISDLNLKNIKIIILDNSTLKFDNEKFCSNKKISYLNMNGNKGISIPYNKAVDYLKKDIKASGNDYIVWLDDDTKITRKYFTELNKNILSHPNIDIFAPVVYGQDGVIYSPNNARYIKNKLVKNRNECFSIKKYNAINSCLCVKMSVFNNYRYDEVLFLDQTDQNFFDDMRNMKHSFKTLDIDIYQNFSQRDKNLDSGKMLIRYKIRTKDIMRYGRKKLKNTFMSFIKAFGLSVQIGLKCKSLKIIFICGGISISMLFKNIKYLLFGGTYKN